MNNLFGMGILITATDMASNVLNSIGNTLNNTRDRINNFSENVSNSFNRVQQAQLELNQSLITGFAMQNMGSQLIGVSNAMMSPIVGLGKNVLETSSQFENWRITLKALYGDIETATKKMDWAMKLAAKTPFEVQDITSSLIGFKAMGVEADTMFKNANGEMRSFLEYVGDLGALRPDVGLNGVMIGIRNLIGGDGGRSLRMRMDMDFEGILGRSWGDTPEQIMKDIVEVSQKIANNLMSELEGTWTQIFSNLDDQKTRFFKSIGEGGAFDGAKKAVMQFYDVVQGIDDKTMAKIGKNISEGLQIIIKPIEIVIQGVSKLLSWLVKLNSQDSKFAKFVTGFLAVGGAVLGVTGILLKFGGTTLTAISTLGLLMIEMSMFGGVANVIKPVLSGLLFTIGKFALAFGAVYFTWKHDLFGIKTLVTNFAKETMRVLSESARISGQSADEMMKSLKGLDKTNFGDNLIRKLVEIRVVWDAFTTIFSGKELSTDQIDKITKLGLAPLVNKLQEAKAYCDSFAKGFQQAWTDIRDTVVNVADFISEQLGKIPWKEFEEGAEKLGINLDNLNTEPIEKLGYALGMLSAVLVGGGIAKALGGLFKPLKPILSGLKWLIFTAIPFLFNGFKKLLPHIVNGAKALFGFALANPKLMLIIGLITAIAVGAYLVYKNWDKISQWFADMWDLAKEKWGEFTTWLGEFVDGVKQWFVDMYEGVCTKVQEMYQGVIDWWNNLVNGVVTFCVDLYNSVIDWWNNLVNSVVTFCTDLYNNAVTWWNNLINGIVNLCVTMYNNVVTWWNDLVNGVVNFCVNLYNNAITWWNNLVTGIVNFCVNLYNNVVTWWSNIWNSIVNFCSNMCSSVSNAWSDMISTAGSILSGLRDTVKEAFDKVKSGIESALKTAKETAQKWWDDIKAIFKTPITATVNFVKSGYDTVVNSWNNLKKKKSDGSHYNGLTYVPYDGYVAELHKGERILTAQESREYRSNNGKADTNLASLGNISKSSNARSMDSSNTTHSQVDNSVVFSSGAIQINVQQATREEADRLAKLIMERIQREQGLRNRLNYRMG